MPQSATPVIPLLTPLDTTIFLIAVCAAVVLAFARWLHKIDVPKGQWITDATGVWTIIVLVLIALSTFTRQVPFFPTVQIPSETELIRDNGILVPLAFLYCAVMIGNNLADTLWRRWRDGFVVMVVWCYRQVRGSK